MTFTFWFLYIKVHSETHPPPIAAYLLSTSSTVLYTNSLPGDSFLLHPQPSSISSNTPISHPTPHSSIPHLLHSVCIVQIRAGRCLLKSPNESLARLTCLRYICHQICTVSAFTLISQVWKSCLISAQSCQSLSLRAGLLLRRIHASPLPSAYPGCTRHSMMTRPGKHSMNASMNTLGQKHWCGIMYMMTN